MPREYEANLPVQNSIYVKEDKNETQRVLRIAYCLPEYETNNCTGILCLIPAYGGNIDSNVYKKMRRRFADQYNLIILQCDYFGIEYMAGYEEEIVKLARQNDYEGNIERKIRLNETWSECNDMGLMQALDVTSMLLWFFKHAIEQKIVFNTEKIIAYGSSHGSYLAYYVNRICPGCLKLIVDNSAYVCPNYLDEVRHIDGIVSDSNNVSSVRVNLEIDYLVKRDKENRLPDEFYDLLSMYTNFDNYCRILSFHGMEDTMVPIIQKRSLISRIGKRASLIEIGREDINGVIFMNAGHGLGVDLIKLYDLIEQSVQFEQGEKLLLPDSVELIGAHDTVKINYENLQPYAVWEKR